MHPESFSFPAVEAPANATLTLPSLKVPARPSLCRDLPNRASRAVSLFPGINGEVVVSSYLSPGSGCFHLIFRNEGHECRNDFLNRYHRPRRIGATSSIRASAGPRTMCTNGPGPSVGGRSLTEQARGREAGRAHGQAGPATSMRWGGGCLHPPPISSFASEGGIHRTR